MPQVSEVQDITLSGAMSPTHRHLWNLRQQNPLFTGVKSSTRHNIIAPVATNLDMHHGTATALPLRSTTTNFNRETKKPTCASTHLARTPNPGKPPHRPKRTSGPLHPQITHNVEELNPRPAVPQSGTINQRIPLTLANSPLLI